MLKNNIATIVSSLLLLVPCLQATDFYGVFGGRTTYQAGPTYYLECAQESAEDFAAELCYNQGWDSGNQEVLINPSENDIEAAIEAMPNESGNTEIFYWCGHGSEGNGICMWGNGHYYTPGELHVDIGASSYDQFVAFIESCYSGLYCDYWDGQAYAEGIIAASSEADQESYYHPEWNYPYYTTGLIDGVIDSDANPYGITAEDLFVFAADAVDAEMGPSQSPQLFDNYSGDLLLDPPPAAPTLSLGSSGGHPYLTWTDGGEPDLYYFVVKKTYSVGSPSTYYIDVGQNYYTDDDFAINPSGGATAQYWVKAMDLTDQSSSYSNMQDTTGYRGMPKAIIDVVAVPKAMALHPASPNPFNPSTTLRYDLPEASSVSLTIYDMMGREVRSWHMQEPAGYRQVVWDGKDQSGRLVPTGIYIYRLVANSTESDEQFTAARKMVLMK